MGGGPLTSGEINSNSGRLFDFESLDEVQEVLNRLQEQEPPYVKLLAKRPGQKEARFVHLLGEVNEEDYDFVSTASDPASNTKIQALESRVESLEEQLARLREEFDKLMEQLS